MTDAGDDATNRAAGPAPLARLAESGWLVGAMAGLVAILWLAGTVPAGGAAIPAAGAGVPALVVPRSAAGARPSQQAEPSEVVWPDTATKLFAEALPDPCLILDRRGIVRFANRRAAEAFPLKAGDALTARLRIPDLLAAFDRVVKGGPPERVEFVERVPTERWFGAWFAPLDRSAASRFVALILDDMTERHRSERIRVDFVANASHELRTPIATLAVFIDTLQGPAREDPVARESFLAIMHDQALRMSRLIDDLLSLSRIEMKAHLRPSQEVDLAGVARHVADALEPLARGLGVTVVLALPDRPAMVTGDRDELIQVFGNLIENACKYGASGGRVEVTVTAATAAGGPTAVIRDFGPGIADTHIPRLTERFYRVDVQESRQHRGTGLGLAIVKHILARHQARMTIESRLGEGAAFQLAFPQAGTLGGSERRQNEYSDQ